MCECVNGDAQAPRDLLLWGSAANCPTLMKRMMDLPFVICCDHDVMTLFIYYLPSRWVYPSVSPLRVLRTFYRSVSKPRHFEHKDVASYIVDSYADT